MTWITATEAAVALGKSRRTIGRMLAAGEIPGAERTPQGWRIPASAVDDQAEPTQAQHDVVAELRAELADWRRRAEVAEAVAAERGLALADTRAALAVAAAHAQLVGRQTEAREITATASTGRRWKWRKRDGG